MKKELTVHLPIVPNFIKVGTEDVPVADFTEAELKEIGKEWTVKLLEKAKNRSIK